jgi:hypothetical protein
VQASNSSALAVIREAKIDSVIKARKIARSYGGRNGASVPLKK